MSDGKSVFFIEGDIEYWGSHGMDMWKTLLQSQEKVIPPVGTVRLLDGRLYAMSSTTSQLEVAWFGLTSSKTINWIAVRS